MAGEFEHPVDFEALDIPSDPITFLQKQPADSDICYITVVGGTVEFRDDPNAGDWQAGDGFPIIRDRIMGYTAPYDTLGFRAAGGNPELRVVYYRRST